jgi:lysozyme family protein
MPDYFDEIIPAVLKNEGIYSDNSSDYGGPTRFGISTKFLQENHPELTLDQIDYPKALELYREDFYDKLQLSALAGIGIQFYLLDSAVNMGPGTAARMVQHALSLAEDGIIGPTTVQAVNAANPDGLLNHLIELRVKRYAQIVWNDPSQLKFLVGWMDRAYRTL